jgi:uncharacterized Zn-binding protein involved in type VI secretion
LGQPIIVLGDKTSHGGVVIVASMFSDTQGKGWARVGDMVACPRCKGVFPIAQGDPGLIDDGKSVAYHGCKTACGATLISSQVLTTTVPAGGGGAGNAATNATKGLGAVAASMLAGYKDEPVDQEAQRFRGRFQLIDQATGKPIAGRQARVTSSSGQEIIDATDDEGFTPWVERDAAESLSFHLIEPQK